MIKEVKTSASQLKAIDKYNKEKTTSITIRLNNKTDADILSKLDTVDSKAGYIKSLIRKDIAENG